MADEGRVVPVEIHGQRYPIRSSLDPEYVARLATYVDEKMRAAADTDADRRLVASGGPRRAEHRRRAVPLPRREPRSRRRARRARQELERLSTGCSWLSRRCRPRSHALLAP